MNLSFAGCGFLGLYHMGVASCFKEYAPNILLNKVSGTSAGALAAAAMLCDCPLSDVIVDSFKVAKAARRHTLGPFHPYIDIAKILRERLFEVLPEDAHLRCNGKLFVSVTRVSDATNYIISEFDSKEELIQALLCTSFIPFFSGYRPPYYREVRYIDGCYTDNQPLLDANTITVSPFCGKSDISPVDSCLSMGEITVGNTHFDVNKMNLGRILRIIFPCDSAMLSKICEQGFYDALNFLKRNNLISCGKCISPLSTLHAKPLCEEERAIQRSDAEPENKDTHKPDSS